MGRIHRYEGTDVIVEFEIGRCIHTGDCTRELPAVFDTRRSGRWVHPDGAPAAAVARICAACPTGALRCIDRASGRDMAAAPARNTVQVIADGPLYVHARMNINGVAASGYRAAFCRCGHSRLMPYCDNSHRHAGFRDQGNVPVPLPSPAADNGMLHIHYDEHGPLQLEGPFVLLDANGKTVCESGRASLCRCGASAMKPYCDGAHRTHGFGKA